MARRSDHTRKELRQLILESASNIVGQEGHEGLTARKIAHDIGYTPGTLYNLFPSMIELGLAVNVGTLGKLLLVLQDRQCNDPGQTPLRNMKAMARLYDAFATEHRNHWLMLFTLTLPDGQEHPDWFRDQVALLFQPLEELLAPYFGPKQTLERKIAARSLWASIHGICFLKETGKLPMIEGQDIHAKVTDTLIETFVSGLERR